MGVSWNYWKTQNKHRFPQELELLGDSGGNTSANLGDGGLWLLPIRCSAKLGIPRTGSPTLAEGGEKSLPFFFTTKNSVGSFLSTSRKPGVRHRNCQALRNSPAAWQEFSNFLDFLEKHSRNNPDSWMVLAWSQGQNMLKPSVSVWQIRGTHQKTTGESSVSSIMWLFWGLPFVSDLCVFMKLQTCGCVSKHAQAAEVWIMVQQRHSCISCVPLFYLFSSRYDSAHS